MICCHKQEMKQRIGQFIKGYKYKIVKINIITFSDIKIETKLMKLYIKMKNQFEILFSTCKPVVKKFKTSVCNDYSFE